MYPNISICSLLMRYFLTLLRVNLDFCSSSHRLVLVFTSAIVPQNLELGVSGGSLARMDMHAERMALEYDAVVVPNEMDASSANAWSAARSKLRGRTSP